MHGGVRIDQYLFLCFQLCTIIDRCSFLLISRGGVVGLFSPNVFESSSTIFRLSLTTSWKETKRIYTDIPWMLNVNLCIMLY